MQKARNINPYSILLMGILLLLMVSPAMAQTTSDMFTPVKQDMSLNILSQMFGDLVTKANGGTNPYVNNGMWLGTGLDPFQYALKFFNMICLSVGGLLAAYTLAIGAVNTAHEGVLLGKELNNPAFWIRTATGAALISPIWNGYCLLQVIVMWFIIASVGIADTTWKAWFGYNEKLVLSESGWLKDSNAPNGSVKDLYSLKMPSPQAAEVVYKAFEGYVCLYGLASEKVDDKVSADRANNTVAQQKNWAIDTEIQQSAQNAAGETKVLMPANAESEGINTGFFAAGTYGTNKTLETLEQETHTKNQDIATQNNENVKNAWNQSVSANVSEQKLHNAAVGMFTANGLKYSGTGTFIFGVSGNKVGADNKGKLTASNVRTGDNNNNSTQSAACGAIDFTKVSGSTAQQKIYDVAMKTEIGAKMADGTKETLQRSVTNQSNTIYKSRVSQDDEATILAVYRELYAEMQDDIRKVALTYVNKINTDARFAKWTDSDPNSNERYALNEDTKNQALIAANEELAVIYSNFEQKLIEKIHAAYLQKEADFENQLANSNVKQASITDLKGRSDLNQTGNFVSFISQARRNAETDGWITAGMWYMNITHSISKLHELTTIRPALAWAEPSNSEFSKLIGKTEVASVGQNPASTIEYWYGFFQKHSQFSPLKSIAMTTTAPVDTTNALAALAMGLDLNDMFDTGRHPIIIMTEAGHNLIASAQKYMTYSSYWQAKTRPMTKSDKGQMIPDPNNPASQAHVMVSYFVGAIMIMGFMMAYYLPVLPFLIWIGSTLGWLLAVIEAVFIASLWGAMHLHPEGSKYTGKGNPGYMLLASLIFRPTLMILGLIASIIIVQVFGMFVNYMFAIGMKLSLGSNPPSSNITVSKMMYVFSIYAIYAIFMNSLITKMFNVMTIMPDNIMKWVGGQQGNLSEYGQIGGNETYGKLNALGSTGGSAYANHLKEKGENAGRADGALVNATMQGHTQSEIMAKQVSTTGQGFNSLKFDEGSNVIGSSSSAYTVGTEGRMPYTHVATANTSVPSTAIEKQAYNDAYDRSLKLADQAGMYGDAAKMNSQKIASMGYNDKNFKAAQESWIERQVFARDQQNASQALTDAANAANAKESMAIMDNYAKSVSGANEVVSRNHTASVEEAIKAAESKSM